MAPEQMQGTAVDARADVFSLGCVLFEMITGRKTFARATPVETLAAILSAPAPDVSATGTDAPPDLARIVSRCLEKQPGSRFQSASDLAFALRALMTAPVGGPVTVIAPSTGPVPQPTSRLLARYWLWSGLAALVLLLAAAVAVFVTSRLRQPSGTPVPRMSNPLQVTTAIGVEGHPTWSPDGRMLAYQSDQSGNQELWVSGPAGALPQQLTADPAPDAGPRWKPDGLEITFYSQRTGKREVWVLPARGGPARQITRSEQDCAYPAWSPDGRTLAFVNHGVGICTISVPGGKERCLTSVPNG